MSPPILVDYKRGGRTVKGLVNVARNGYLWFLERGAGPIRFVQGKPYVRQTVFREPRSRNRPPRRRSRSQARHRQEGREHLPVALGRQELAADRLQPEDADDLHPGQREPLRLADRHEVEYEAGERYIGASSGLVLYPGADHVGEVQAWNVDTGQRVWTHNYPTSANWGSMLATAGGLVFSGGTNDRKLHAFDATSGKLLWEFPTNSGILAPPSSFTIDGKQYIAVQSGWGIDSRGMQSRLNTLTNGAYPEVPEGGAIWLFALPD